MDDAFADSPVDDSSFKDAEDILLEITQELLILSQSSANSLSEPPSESKPVGTIEVIDVLNQVSVETVETARSEVSELHAAELKPVQESQIQVEEASVPGALVAAFEDVGEAETIESIEAVVQQTLAQFIESSTCEVFPENAVGAVETETVENIKTAAVGDVEMVQEAAPQVAEVDVVCITQDTTQSTTEAVEAVETKPTETMETVPVEAAVVEIVLETVAHTPDVEVVYTTGVSTTGPAEAEPVETIKAVEAAFVEMVKETVAQVAEIEVICTPQVSVTDAVEAVETKPAETVEIVQLEAAVVEMIQATVAQIPEVEVICNSAVSTTVESVEA